MLVREEGVCVGWVDAEAPPGDEVGVRDGEAVGGVGGVGERGCDGRDGVQSDDAFDGEVGLIVQLAGEVVCRH